MAINAKSITSQWVPSKYRDLGFRIEVVEQRPDDTIYELYFKDAPTGRRFSELFMTEEGIGNACEQVMEELNAPVP